MPRYFFHIREGSELIEDLEGVDLPDIASVEEEAIQAAREILADRIKSGKVIDGQAFHVVDANGARVAQIPFKAALRLD